MADREVPADRRPNGGGDIAPVQGRIAPAATAPGAVARRARRDEPMPAGLFVPGGEPVVELPPIVEPVDMSDFAPDDSPLAAVPDESFADTGGSLRTVRPPRRSFLAPVGSAAQPVSARSGSPSAAPRNPLPPAPAPAPSPPPVLQLSERADAPLATPPMPEWTAEPPAVPPRQRGFGRGVVAATILAVAGVVGASIFLLSPFSSQPLRQIPGGAGATNGSATAAAPQTTPTAQEQRFADVLARAKLGDADAQLEIAILYAKGEGVTQDYAAAANWFRGAAEKGLPRAQYDLGVLYERGRGLPVDMGQAVSWYRRSAEGNFPLAQYNLGVAYTKGQGAPQDFKEAAMWYRRAATQGVIPAMVNLAILYERGDGVEASRVDAYGWYRAASTRGSQAAAARRADELLPSLSPAEQVRAEAKASEVLASIREPVAERPRAAAPTSGAVVGPGPATGSGAAPVDRLVKGR